MAKSRRDAAARAGGSAHPEIAAIERPTPAGTNAPGFGSDVVAETLRDLDIPYIALNPGASYRGLHDSLVNYLGNAAPQMLLCLHEEAAIAIAHGYAKVTGRAMAAAVHSNVGLMHGTMAIFNAWCDRMPIIILGATGPVDAVKRRPWIDWIHTARDQGALVRHYTKWDDQPASPGAAREGAPARLVARQCGAAGAGLHQSRRRDAGGEARRAAARRSTSSASFRRSRRRPRPRSCARRSSMLASAKHPLILAGRVSRSLEAWKARVALAEAVGARVGTNLKVGAAFPTDHPLHVSPPAAFVNEELVAAIKQADVIVSLDWVDLAGTFKSAGTPAQPGRPPRSSRSRSTRTSTTAGAWTIRRCRRSTCSSRPIRTRPWRRCSRPCRRAARRPGSRPCRWSSPPRSRNVPTTRSRSRISRSTCSPPSASARSR